MAWKDLPQALRFYILFLALAGAGAFVVVSYGATLPVFSWSLVIFSLLAVATATGMNLKIPFTEVHFSMDTAFVYTVIMLFGPLPAMVVDGFCKIVNTLWFINRVTWYKLPFNVGSGVLSVFTAAMVYQALLPADPVYIDYVLPLIAMTISYFLVNSFTVAVAIAISTRGHLIKLWLDNFLWTGIGFFVATSIALLMYILHSVIGPASFVVSVPIVTLVWYLQRVHEKREQDAQDHIAKLETMHMSTIETLSLAIDAKDQITHGHVHRVTAYVTRLAELLGVDDPEELKGLRFAALVHDIGKIGIPDLILSKPGRFSSEEMDRMKMHPVIGAQIVKAVSNDFPIGDVVLSHHERWDGTGYPHKLAGEEINRFARMLAICDVYDALRSDRPYRRAMDRKTAIGIIREGRDQSFDPEITDVFLENLNVLEEAVADEDKKLAQLAFSTPSSTDGINGIHDPLALYGQITYTQQEVFLLYEVAQMVGSNISTGELAHGLITSVSKLIAYNSAVVFTTDAKTRQLKPLYVESRDSETLSELRVDFGGGVSGWVAQNARPMRNVDPQVELEGLAIQDQSYHAALSVPLLFDAKIVGVITLYSEKKDFYQERHQDLLTKLASMVTPALVNSMRSGELLEEVRIDPITGLGNARAMKRYFEQDLAGHQQLDPYSLYLLNLNNFQQINQLYGHEVGDRVIKELAMSVQNVLRPEDECFRCGADELALIAHGADAAGAEVLAARLRKTVGSIGVHVSGGVLSPELSLGFATYPTHGMTPEQLWRQADGEVYRDKVRRGAVLAPDEPDDEVPVPVPLPNLRRV
jgi:diguanylate cyclase (GGDEF)-like protein